MFFPGEGYVSYCFFPAEGYVSYCSFLVKDMCLNELDKNVDKQHDVACVPGSAPSEHLEELLSSLQRHLLAYCYTNAADDNLVRI